MTIESEEWDVFSSIGKATPPPSPPSKALDALAKQHLEVSQQIEELMNTLGQIENEIAHAFPEEAGETALSTDGYEIVCNRSERWSWDKKILETIFAQGDLPDYVKRSMSVDKRKFLKLPTSEQEQIKSALTRTLDKPKIKVIPHV